MPTSRRPTHRDTALNAHRASVFQCVRDPQSQPVSYGFVLRRVRFVCTTRLRGACTTTQQHRRKDYGQMQFQHQRWGTLTTGQLQLRGTDLCLGLLDPQSTQSDTAAVPCSTTPFLTIAFGQPSLESNFWPLGFDSTTAVLQPLIYNFSTLNPDTGLVYLFGDWPPIRQTKALDFGARLE